MKYMISMQVIFSVASFIFGDCTGVGFYSDIVVATFDGKIVKGKSVLNKDDIDFMNQIGQIESRLTTVKTFGSAPLVNRWNLQDKVQLLTDCRSLQITFYELNQKSYEKTEYRYNCVNDISIEPIKNIYKIMYTDSSGEQVYNGQINIVTEVVAARLSELRDEKAFKLYTGYKDGYFIFSKSGPEEEISYFDDKYDVFYIYLNNQMKIDAIIGKKVSYELISNYLEKNVLILGNTENICY